ncbi:hypothetical protein T11_10237 [Trichinella zimbabwensis]|uniref:Uncharacterized protein n=1 Tax=Trichinella zimbabwensis TaxID=268475 RepID=A0A0V1GQG6_9BILA|nr:hypothetical protein T11_10237 [Trichinella zimbabwensis]
MALTLKSVLPEKKARQSTSTVQHPKPSLSKLKARRKLIFKVVKVWPILCCYLELVQDD